MGWGRRRQLCPEAEKVIRMYFGLGCQRCHSAQEVAAEFGVTAQGIAALIGAAQRRLAREGVTAAQLRAAARQERQADTPIEVDRWEFEIHVGPSVVSRVLLYCRQVLAVTIGLPRQSGKSTPHPRRSLGYGFRN